MIKITCIIHSLSIGGMERVMSILLNNFAKRAKTEVSVLLIGRYRKVAFELDDSIQVFKPSFTFDNTKRNITTLKTLSFIRITIKSIQPDSILSFGEVWNNLVLLSLRGLDFPVYISDRSQPDKNLGILHNLLRNLLYPKVSGYIAQTSPAAEIARSKHWNKNISIIGNPARDLNLPKVQQENLVLSVGRLIPTKNIDKLIQVFSEIDNTNWQLKIIGGNAKKMNLLDTYTKLVKDLGKTSQIKLLGEQKNIEEYLAKSKIFAFMSTSEGFPNALAEAMSAGCACIAYDCFAGPSDLIDDGTNGFLIPVGDEELYQQKLELLMNDKSLQKKLSKNAQEKMKQFDADKIAKRFYDVLTENL